MTTKEKYFLAYRFARSLLRNDNYEKRGYTSTTYDINVMKWDTRGINYRVYFDGERAHSYTFEVGKAQGTTYIMLIDCNECKRVFVVKHGDMTLEQYLY